MLAGSQQLALVALGIGIGSRIAAPKEQPRSRPPRRPARAAPSEPAPSNRSRTEAGAVAAAACRVDSLDGPALLDSARIRELVDRLAASTRTRCARARLCAGRGRRSRPAGSRLRPGSGRDPPLGARWLPVDELHTRRLRRSPSGASGSSAAAPPCSRNSLGARRPFARLGARRWKVVSFASAPGPTPPLPRRPTASTAGDLFTEIPRFREFSHALP